MRVRQVIIVPSWYPSQKDPINGIFVEDQAECLASRFDVTVMMPRFARSGVAERNGVRVWTLVKPPWISPLRLGWLAHSLLRQASQYESALAAGLRRYIAQHGKPDVLHAHNVLPAGWAAMRVGRRYGIPTVVTEHSSNFSRNMAVPAQRRLAVETMRRADRLLAVGTHLAATMRSFCPDATIDVLGNVIRTRLFVPPATPPARGRLRFFCLCLMTKKKGIDCLLDAARLLLDRKVDDFELVFGGDGVERRALEARAKRLGLADRCRFIGLLVRPASMAHMQECDVFILPSLTETFGVVLGEAMACGKPVISTHCGGPDDVVPPDGGVLVQPGDAAALAGAMEAMMRDRRRFDPAVIRKSVSDRFGEDVFTDRIAAVYEALRP